MGGGIHCYRRPFFLFLNKCHFVKMGTNNSIFEFGDKFGIESPLGDWGATIDSNSSRPTPIRIAIAQETPQIIRGISLQNAEIQNSRIVVSDIHEPTAEGPGSALITISMSYQFVTEGEGQIPRIDGFDFAEFAKLYSKGNNPGQVYKEGVLLKRLPSATNPCQELSEEEMRMVRKKNPTFHQYYLVAVKYEFSLSYTPNWTFISGLLWCIDAPEVRGLCLNPLFPAELKEFYRKSKQTISEFRKELIKSGSQDFRLSSKEELEDLKLNSTENSRLCYEALWVVYLIMNLVNLDLERHRDRIIYFKPRSSSKWPTNPYFLANPSLTDFLVDIGSGLAIGQASDSQPSDIPSFDKLLPYVEALAIYCLALKPEFEEGKTDPITGNNLPTYAGGTNPTFLRFRGAFVITNPTHFSGRKAASQLGQEMGYSIQELFVHETGHNLAEVFLHDKVGYSYSDPGLSSSNPGQVYPTKMNTMNILRDGGNQRRIITK